MGCGLLPDVGWGLQNHTSPWLPSLLTDPCLSTTFSC